MDLYETAVDIAIETGGGLNYSNLQTAETPWTAFLSLNCLVHSGHISQSWITIYIDFSVPQNHCVMPSHEIPPAEQKKNYQRHSYASYYRKKTHQPFHQPPTNPKRDQTVGLFSDIPVTGSGSFCLSRIVNQPPVGGPLVSRPFQARPGPVEQQSVDVEIPSGTLTLLPGISPFLVGDIGDTSSKGPFAIAMLAYRSVISPGYALKIGSYEKYESSNSFECLHFHWGTV